MRITKRHGSTNNPPLDAQPDLLLYFLLLHSLGLGPLDLRVRPLDVHPRAPDRMGSRTTRARTTAMAG